MKKTEKSIFDTGEFDFSEEAINYLLNQFSLDTSLKEDVIAIDPKTDLIFTSSDINENYLNRKRASMLLRKFDNDAINQLMEELRNIKTKADLDKLVSHIHMLEMMIPDENFQKELQEFMDILNKNSNALRIKKQNK